MMSFGELFMWAKLWLKERLIGSAEKTVLSHPAVSSITLNRISFSSEGVMGVLKIGEHEFMTLETLDGRLPIGCYNIDYVDRGEEQKFFSVFNDHISTIATAKSTPPKKDEIVFGDEYRTREYSNINRIILVGGHRVSQCIFDALNEVSPEIIMINDIQPEQNNATN